MGVELCQATAGGMPARAGEQRVSPNLATASLGEAWGRACVVWRGERGDSTPHSRHERLAGAASSSSPCSQPMTWRAATRSTSHSASGSAEMTEVVSPAASARATTSLTLAGWLSVSASVLCSRLNHAAAQCSQIPRCARMTTRICGEALVAASMPVAAGMQSTPA